MRALQEVQYQLYEILLAVYSANARARVPPQSYKAGYAAAVAFHEHPVSDVETALKHTLIMVPFLLCLLLLYGCTQTRAKEVYSRF